MLPQPSGLLNAIEGGEPSIGSALFYVHYTTIPHSVKG